MRSVVFWTKENPSFIMELEHNSPHMTLLVGNTVTCITGPYFDRHIKTSMHRAMLETWLIPELRARRKMNGRWLQHDGPPTHFAATVCDILNDHFSRCWIGQRSKTSPTTLWPPTQFGSYLPENPLGHHQRICCCMPLLYQQGVALCCVMGLHHQYCTDVVGTSHRKWRCSGLSFEHGSQQPMNLSKNITEYNI
jgi:hypothetical protein